MVESLMQREATHRAKRLVVLLGSVGRHDFVMFRDAAFEFQKKTEHVI